MPALFVAAAGLLASCGGPPEGEGPTQIRLAVVATSTRGVDRVRVEGRLDNGIDAFSPVETPLPGGLVPGARTELPPIPVPEAFAGRPIALSAEARLSSGAVRAAGRTTVVLLSSAITPAEISLLEVARCGDRLVATSSEACDDGGLEAGDGCSPRCTIEPGFACSGEPSACADVCGSGVVVPGEACDDGDLDPGDGCSPRCEIEWGWFCSGAPSRCDTDCGDRVPAGAETCDDGNRTERDGCSSTCIVERGFSCTGAPSACGPICGDGLLRTVEGCDDQNVAAGDGCGATCTIEDDWFCFGEPSACTRAPRTVEVRLPDPVHIATTTFSEVPNAELRFTPRNATDVWLVFVSGKIRATDDAPDASELRLMVNGAEADRFGHQTQGPDGWAGFVTFERITGTIGPQRVTVELRANPGSVSVDDLRLVAAVLPPGADPHFFEDDATATLAGRDVDLGVLSFTPPSPGDYVVLGKTSQSESPGATNVASWVVDPAGGEHPPGAHFAGSRSNFQPFFTAFVARLGPGPATIGLRGASSGAGDFGGEGWRYRRRVAIAPGGPGSAVPIRESIAIRFDHRALVAAGKSLASGADVRVARQSGGAWATVPFVLDDDSAFNRPDTLIWFRLDAPVAPGATDTRHYLLYGNSESSRAASVDPAQVFELHEGFGAAAIDPAKWLVLAGGAPAVSGGAMTLAPGSRVRSVSAFGPVSRWEARLSLSSLTAERLRYFGASDRDDFAGNYVSLFTAAGGLGHRIASGDQSGGTFESASAARTATASHVYAFQREGFSAVRFFQDGVELGATGGAGVPPGNLRVLLSNDSDPPGGATMRYDWIRVRVAVTPGPRVTLEPEEDQLGQTASQWRYRRLVAFRADAFAAADFDQSPGESTTTSSMAVIKNALTTAARAAPSELLAIQNVRISGEATSVNQRKSGVIRAGGSVVLETSHRIDRSGGIAGYHHNAAAVHTLEGASAITFENGFSSPDGQPVQAADSAIIVLRYAPRP